MKQLFFLFFIVIYSSTINAQEFADKDFYLVDSLVLEDLSEYDKNLTDSLLTIYHQEKEDTTRFVILKNIIHGSSNYEFTQKIAKVLYRYTDDVLAKTNSDKVKHLARYYKGVYYMNKAFAYSHYGSSDDLYMSSLDSAAQLFSLINEPTPLLAILIYKASHFQETGQHKRAINLYQEAILDSEKINFINGQIQGYYGIGTVRMELEEEDDALINFKKSLELANEKKSTIYIGRNLLVIGHIYISKNLLDSAKIAINTAIENSESINHLDGIAHGQYLLGSIAVKEGMDDKANKYFQDNIETYRKLKDHSGLSLNLIASAELKHKNGLNNSAKLDAEKAYEISLSNNHLVRLKTVTLLLADIYEALGLESKSNKMLRLNLAHKDSLYNSQNKETLLNQKIEYQYEKQKEINDLAHEQEILLSEAERQRTQIGLFAAALIALIIAIASYFIYSRLKVIRSQKVKLDAAYAELEESKKNELAVSNLKALQSQMNPHFIFNALNSVQDLVLFEDIRNSNKYLGKFSDLIRKILLSSKEQFISLEEEVEILGLYLDLEKLRFGDEFQIDFTCDIQEERQEEIQLPAMFVQPYIENAIKHGLFNKKGEKRLQVAFSFVDETTLECIIEDNGIGQKQATILRNKHLHRHTGFSTEAINERIRLLNQTLDRKIELQVIDLEENGVALGTKIILHFPI